MPSIMNSYSYCQAGGEDPTVSPRWLTIFNDLITLLLVFFVLMFSLSSMNIQRFQNLQKALQSAMGVLNGGSRADRGILSKEVAPNAADIDAAERRSPTNTFPGLAMKDGLEAKVTPKGIQLVLDNRLLFATGSARLSNDGMRMLKQVGSAIKPLNRTIRVEGFTDDLPIQTHQYPSNWELSAARAISVVKYFIETSGIAPSRLSAAGYGSSRPRVSNTSALNRFQNRRVEIILGPPVTLQPLQAQKDNGGN